MPASNTPQNPEPESGGYDIDIALLDTRWAQALPEIQALCEAGAKAASDILGTALSADLSIAFMDDTQIQALNSQYRGKDTPTNVLSFPSVGPLLGDIVLSYETIAREAEAKSVSFSNHLSHLLIHGFLHLQGYDHLTDTDAAEMEAIEITALAQLGIDNPYEKQTIK